MGKLIEAKELGCAKRTPLHEVIPLSGPLGVFIDPSNICNIRCRFCPTSDPALLKGIGRKPIKMDMGLFNKIVSDLKEFDVKIKLINLYKDGESLLHHDLPEMIQQIKTADICERVWLKTNGVLLNPELNRRIVNAGLDYIGISVEAVSAEGYKKIAGVDLNYEKFLENIGDLYAHRKSMSVYIKIADYGQPREEIEKFYQDFKNICDCYSVETLTGWSNSAKKDFKLGTAADNFQGNQRIKKIVCPFPFYIMAINSNGDVSLCCADWSHGTVVGNVYHHSLKEIWTGEDLFRFRMMHLEGRRHENPACNNCDYLETLIDNLDDYRSMLAQKLKDAPSPASALKRDSLGSQGKI